MLIGFGQMLVSAYILVYFIKQTGIKYWQIVACFTVLLIFDPNTYHSAMMAMEAVQNNGIITLFLLSLYLYYKDHKVWAVVSQSLMVFTSGSGVMGAALLVVLCFVVGKSRMVSFVTSAVLISLYFVGYHSCPLPDALPFDWSRTITYFVKVIGAPFSFDNAGLYGCLVLIVLLFVIPYKKWREHAPLLILLLFVMGSIALAAIFRANSTTAQFQTSRYLIYPQLLIALMCIFLLIVNTKLTKKISYVIMILWLFIYYPSNYIFGKRMFEITAERQQSMKFYTPAQKAASQISKQACADDIYCIDENR